MLGERTDLRIDLTRHVPALELPFKRILDAWTSVRFEPGASARVLASFVERGECEPDDVSIEGALRDGIAVADRVLHPAPGPWHAGLSDYSFTSGARRACAWELTEPAARELARELRGAGPIASEIGRSMAALLRAMPAAAPRETWPRPTAPGLYRREHANMVIRSREATILVDPIGASGPVNAGMRALPRPPAGEHVDAVLVTHGHSDHWHLPSLLAALGPDGIAIVPRVPTRSLLSPYDFADQLAKTSIRHVAPAWGEVVRVGDAEIEILPFTGEQPARDRAWSDLAIRNWGNCYRVDTPDASVVLLADGGRDPGGDLRSALAESRAKRGPVDALSCCLRELACPFAGGLAHYWAPFPLEALRALYAEFATNRLPCVTAGPSGVAELCAAAGARYFLPYAHGFDGLGQPIRDVGWGLGEAPEHVLLELLWRALRALRVSTVPIAWNPGDVALFRGGDARVLHVPAPERGAGAR